MKDIGGLEEQIEEIKEAVELPLIHPEYYEDMGITAPKGVILYGEPGTGIFSIFPQIYLMCLMQIKRLMPCNYSTYRLW